MATVEEIEKRIGAQHFLDFFTRIDEELMQVIELLVQIRDKPITLQAQQVSVEAQPDFITPQRRDWCWRVIRLPDKTLAPLSEETLYYEERAGWLYWAFLSCDNPYLTVNLDLESEPGKLELQVNPKMLYDWGFSASVGGFRVIRYDDSAKVYTVEFAPGTLSAFGTPYRDKIRCWLTNPTTSAIKYTFQAWLIQLQRVD